MILKTLLLPELHSTEGWERPLENNTPFLFCSYAPWSWLFVAVKGEVLWLMHLIEEWLYQEISKLNNQAFQLKFFTMSFKDLQADETIT